MDLLTNIPGKQSAPEARTHNISTVDDNSSQHTEAHGIAEARTVNPDSTAAALTAAEEILDAKQQVQYENVPGVEEQSTGVEEQSTAAALTATEDIAKQQVRYENLQLKAAVKEGRQHTSDEPRDAGAVSHISPDSQHHPLKQELQQPPAQAPPDDMAQLPQSQDTPHNHKVPVNPPQEESGQQNYPIVAGSTVSQRQPAATDTLIIDPPPEMSYNLGVGSLIKIPTVGGIFKYGTIKWTGHLQPHMQGVVAGIEMAEPMEGYSDGTFQATGEKFFACSYGRGLYYPLNNLKLDKRCPPGMATNGQLDPQLNHQENWKPQLQGKESEIQENNRITEDQKTAEQQQAAEELKIQLNELSTKFKDQCYLVKSQSQKIVELQQLSTNLQVQLDELQKKEKMCKGLIKSKKQEVAKLQQTSMNLRVQFNEVFTRLQDKEKVCRSSEDLIKINNQKIAELQQTSTNLKVHIHKQSIKLQDKELANEGLIQKIAQLQQQLAIDGDFKQFTDMQPPPTNEAGSWNVPRVQVQRIYRKKIGAGAWGDVYSGKFCGQDVAIKIAHQEIFHESTVAMLKREVMIMSHIQHPNLVRFIAAVWDDAVEQKVDTPIIISELMELNLRDAYSKKDLSKSLISIFCDIAYALHYLHQRRQPIIHRDLSAPNVLLKSLPNGSYQAKVSDFGSANLVKLGKTAGIGSIVYSAPEMFPSEDISVPPQPQTIKVDVFSYGILLLEVLSKEMPTPERRYALLQNLQRQQKAMYELIVHCTKKSPSDRCSMVDILYKFYNL